MNNDRSNGFVLNLTNKVTMPDVDYINELAREKNFALGTSFKNPPRILEDLYYLFRKEQQDPDTFELNNHLFSQEYLETDVLFRPLTEGEKAYYNHTLLFLEKVDFSNIIGITPLDKALNVMMYLVHLSTKTNPGGNNPHDETNNPKQDRVDIKDEEQLAEAMKEMGQEGPTGDDGGQGGSGAVRSPEDQGDEMPDLAKCVRDHLYDLTPSIANVYGAKKPSDVPINRKILGDIKIKAYLENSVGMSTALDTKKVKNNDSNERKKFQMDNHNQITKIRKSAMMSETFDEKFIKKELDVNEKVKPEEKKQILYMLLDDSGSMRCKVKQTYVRAVLLNRLESVVDGKSELMFYLYESKRYNEMEVKDKKAAQKLYKDISLRRPGGGGTYIGHILQETIDEIHNKKGYHDPEIMIVCDGDDKVNPDDLKYKGVRINVVLLGTTNKDLERIAKETGGFFTCEKLYSRY